MGLVIFAAIGIYFLIAIGVVSAAAAYARRMGKNVSRWGWGAALIMYLIPCWDLIPTLLSHQYYCASEAGLQVVKTPKQWLKENPGVIETLVDTSPQKYPNWPREKWRGMEIASINQRFGILYKDHLSNSGEGELFINVWRWQTELLDKQTGDVIARDVRFTTGNDGYIGGFHALKFWLTSDGCSGRTEDSERFRGLLAQLRGRQK